MTRAYLISIGNELLSGQTVDTNAAWLAGQLLAAGIATAGVSLVPDETDRIVQTLKEACRLADLVLLTGGLGPTDDDLTRQALADFTGRPLEFQPELLAEIESYFSRLGRPMAVRNRIQAYLPRGAAVLHNPVGTAPGIRIEQGGKVYAAMPGVPSEMKKMFADCILPELKSRSNGETVIVKKVRCFGPGESDLAEKLGDRMSRDCNPLINCTVGEGVITLHIVARAADREAAMGLAEKDRRMLCELLGDWVFGFDEETLPQVLADKLVRQGKTLAFAESCTGGLCSKLMTDLPGSSRYFLAGWVTYSNEAKMRELGVPEELLRQYGAVSAPVAEAMAQGVAQRSGADVTAAITGIAGPEGGTEQKPVGTVYISVWIEGKCQVMPCRFSPVSREAVRLRSALTALNWIRLKLDV